MGEPDALVGRNHPRMSDADLEQAMSDASEDYANAGMELDAARRKGDEAARRAAFERATDARNAMTQIAREMQRRGLGR